MLNKQQINNNLVFLARVSVQGEEVMALAELIAVLNTALQDESKPPSGKKDGDK